MLIRKTARLSIKTIFWLFLPLVCVELSMIVLDPYLFKGFEQYDPDLGFRVRAHYPNSDGSLTNQFGFNDRDYSLQKTQGTFRILVVGDSFGWAGGLEGNYTALLERKFENYYGEHKIDVINIGYPGTHTGEQLLMLKKYGLQYNPDLVVLGFFCGNDFLDADPDRKRIIVNNVYIDISKKHEHTLLGYPLIPESRLLLFLTQKYRIYAEFRKAASEAQSQKAQLGTLSEETYLNIERARFEFFNANPSYAGRFQPNIDYILQSISEMDALLKSRNIKFVVATYPDEFQVNENLRRAIFEKFKLKQDYDPNLAQSLLRSFLESKSIPFIDLSDRFRTEGKKQDLYLLRDTHWNSAGNQLAADILFEDMVKRVDNPQP